MDVLMAILFAIAGGLAGGLIGVGGGILFVPALTIFLGLSQVEGESTSLLMIVIVARSAPTGRPATATSTCATALIIGVLSPLGVLIGVVVANSVSERFLQLSLRRPGPVLRLQTGPPRALRALGRGAALRSR